jgi:hypothetical protein
MGLSADLSVGGESGSWRGAAEKAGGGFWIGGGLGEGLSWQETLEKYQRALPDEYREAFGKACLEPVERIVKGGRK